MILAQSPPKNNGKNFSPFKVLHVDGYVVFYHPCARRLLIYLVKNASPFLESVPKTY